MALPLHVDSMYASLDEAIASRVHARVDSLRHVFLEYDKYGTGLLTPTEMTYAIRRSLRLDVSEEQIRALMCSFNDSRGVGGRGGRFRYEDFVDFVENNHHHNMSTEAQRYGRLDPAILLDVSAGVLVPPPGAARDEIMACVARKLRSRSSMGLPVHELFLDFDRDRCGKITSEEFQQWFLRVGLRLSDDQVKMIVEPFDDKGDGKLSYSEFSRLLSEVQLGGPGKPLGGPAPWELPDEQEEKDRLARRQRAERLAAREVARRSREAFDSALSRTVDDALSDGKLLANVAERMDDKKMKLMKAFRAADKDGSGTVTAAEFAEICRDKLGVAVSDERFKSLFEKFDVTGTGGLKYFEFVRMIGSVADREEDDDHQHAATEPEAKVEVEAAAGAAAAAAGGQGGGGGGGGGGGAATAATAEAFAPVGTPEEAKDDPDMVAQAEVVGRLTADDTAVLHAFRDTLRSTRVKTRQVFRRFDQDGSKTVGADEFMQGLKELGVEVTKEEAARLVKHFDKSGSGKIRYYEFVRMLSEASEI